MSHIPEYRAWTAMKYRCNNPRCDAYEDYGGRGIKVCEWWNSSFDHFINDMGRKPGKRYSIDRIDNDLGYSPENCRWAIPEEQTNNRRTNVRLVFAGTSKTIAQWARHLGIKDVTLRARLFIWGWPVEKALGDPVRVWERGGR